MGTTSETGGMISATRNMKTVMVRRLVTTTVIRSPESGGREKDKKLTPGIRKQYIEIVTH